MNSHQIEVIHGVSRARWMQSKTFLSHTEGITKLARKEEADARAAFNAADVMLKSLAVVHEAVIYEMPEIINIGMPS